MYTNITIIHNIYGGLIDIIGSYCFIIVGGAFIQVEKASQAEGLQTTGS